MSLSWRLLIGPMHRIRLDRVVSELTPLSLLSLPLHSVAAAVGQKNQ